MAVCEKCWADARRRAISNPHKSQAEHYIDLIEERKDKPCEKIGRAVTPPDEVVQGVITKRKQP